MAFQRRHTESDPPCFVKKVFIISLGQLINSDINRTIEAYLSLLKEKKVLFPKWRLNYALFRCQINGDLNKIYKGELAWTAFVAKVNRYLGIKLNAHESKHCWNEMITNVNEYTDELKNVIALAASQEATLLIYSKTNQLHVEKIFEAFKQRKVPLKSEATLFALSCDPALKEADPAILVSNAIKIHQLDKANTHFILLSDRFAKKESFGIVDGTLTCDPYDRKKTSLLDHMTPYLKSSQYSQMDDEANLTIDNPPRNHFHTRRLVAEREQLKTRLINA